LGNHVEDIHRDLVQQCRAGEAKAQHQLYQLYAKAMYNICTRMLNNEMEAQDVLQESFIAAFGNLHQHTGKATFGAWLKRIVINNCISALNKSKKLNWVAIDEQLEHQLHVEQDDKVDSEWSPGEVHAAIRELPTGCRTVFTLYSLEGYDHEEIAGILKVSVSTSKSQYSRAKQLLRISLKKKESHENRYRRVHTT
jgi:RNA polymerase sigma factor (sigma-70 family)